MEIKAFLVVFASIFLAELGDKTQLATMLFASDKQLSPMAVFLAASMALTLSAALAVAAGHAISGYVDPRHLSLAAGVGFVVIGLWTVAKAL